MKNCVRNTTEEVKQAPMVMFAEAMLTGASGAIERQEAAGQAELCMSDVLPADGIESVRKMIEDNGGMIGDPVSGDKIFVSVRLPIGWKKRSTDHSMWSELLDAKGRKRAAIFYKAAFYDRSAHINTVRRFGVDVYSHEITPEGFLSANITDACGEVSHSVTGSLDMTKPERERKYLLRDKLEADLVAWLNQNYPDWGTDAAYWD